MQLILFIRIIFINGSCKYCVFTMVTVVFQSIFLVTDGSHRQKLQPYTVCLSVLVIFLQFMLSKVILVCVSVVLEIKW